MGQGVLLLVYTKRLYCFVANASKCGYKFVTESEKEEAKLQRAICLLYDDRVCCSKTDLFSSKFA